MLWPTLMHNKKCVQTWYLKRVTIITTYQWELWRILRTVEDDDEARNSREVQKISVSRRHEDLCRSHSRIMLRTLVALSNLMITSRPIFWPASGRIIVSDESWLTLSWYRQYVWSHTQQCRDDRVAGENENVQSTSWDIFERNLRLPHKRHSKPGMCHMSREMRNLRPDSCSDDDIRPWLILSCLKS